jgi:GMP synthase-like glutamine amidotransferase
MSHGDKVTGAATGLQSDCSNDTTPFSAGMADETRKFYARCSFTPEVTHTTQGLFHQFRLRYLRLRSTLEYA